MLTDAAPEPTTCHPTRGALIWEADPVTFQFTYVSRSAEQLMGYSLEDWLTRPTFWSDIIHPDDRLTAVGICRGAVASCADHEFEYRVIGADRRVVLVRDIVRVVCNGCGQPIALRGAMVEVTASDRTQVDLTSAIAHDLNNVLVAIQGHAELALRGSLDDDTRRSIEAIARAGQLGSALSARLTSAGEPQSATPTLVDVSATMTNVDVWLRELVGQHIDVDIWLDAPGASVCLAAGELEQILLNLAINARDAMPSGGEFSVTVWPESSIRLRPADAHGALVIEVSDTGAGIAPDLLPRIFDRQVTTKPIGEGSGIGLSTVSSIVRRAGGLISCNSRPGVGTTFLITLPLAPILH